VKKIAVMLALVSALTLAMLGLATLPAFAGNGSQNDPFGPGDKVTFCHYDGSETGGGSGKYNQPDASTTATGPAGHIGHAFDVIPSYFFQQNQNDPVTFYAGVNWPTLTNLPSSPVDFTPLLGSSAATFIASGCAEPVVSTTAPPTSTVPPTTTAPPTTTQPPVTTTTAATTTATTPPPTSTTTPPPPVGGGNPPPGPGGNPNPNQGPGPNNAPPQELAFTGPEGITGWLGAHRVEAFAGLSLLAFGGFLMMMRGWALSKEED
jgi:hypothetical protein